MAEHDLPVEHGLEPLSMKQTLAYYTGRTLVSCTFRYTEQGCKITLTAKRGIGLEYVQVHASNLERASYILYYVIRGYRDTGAKWRPSDY